MKKTTVMERPVEGAPLTERWKMAEKAAIEVIKHLPNICADINTNLVKCE